ncbi:uncharacterized protein LAJ45_06629 [Morchella importuna]|uniref:uncharacterized protein n=1 Tax=Morchella importuna TaxID=1174673 RepID=UPI001E8E145E|nr:uncharacterized protein LAJ45_06629 [Morchella importuna]KAH8149090.1 hypothetical protein LAJ45_06629 [Morchella importuna]
MTSSPSLPPRSNRDCPPPPAAPSANQAPADIYLHFTPIGQWGMLDYLTSNPSLTYTYLTSSWVLTLSPGTLPTPRSRRRSRQLHFSKDFRHTAASDDTADLSGVKRAAQRGAGSHWGTDDLRGAQQASCARVARPTERATGGCGHQNSFNHSKIDLNTAPVNALAGLMKGTSGALRAARGKTAGRKRKRDAEGQGNFPSVNSADVPSSKPGNILAPSEIRNPQTTPFSRRKPTSATSATSSTCTACSYTACTCTASTSTSASTSAAASASTAASTYTAGTSATSAAASRCT